jgi:hypothetical protein
MFDFGEAGTHKRMIAATIDYHHDPGGTATWTWYYEDGTTSSSQLIEGSDASDQDISRSLCPLTPAGWFRSVMGEFLDSGGLSEIYLYGMSFNMSERQLAGKLIN